MGSGHLRKSRDCEVVSRTGFLTAVVIAWDTRGMDEGTPTSEVAGRVEAAVMALRRHGAVFAYLHGSQASDSARPGSDVDVAAYFPEPAPQSFHVGLPPGVDLMVLNHAPLELRGQVAARGRLLFEDDRPARVDWEAMTRKIYFDELPRITRAHREFIEALGRG